MSQSPVLAADSIGKQYWGKRVLSSASLWARAGCLTALLGRNGSGKSTLIKIAAGWLQPDYGVVIFQDRRFPRPRLPQLARLGLFYLPERSMLASTCPLRDHFRALARRFPGAAVGQVILDLRLSALLDRKPPSLSTGERRRAEVALAVARAPVCLLADEPLRDLAPLDCELVGAALQALAHSGSAVVASGHETASLLELSDEVIWQTAGTTHSLGPPSKARTHHQFMREYFGVSA